MNGGLASCNSLPRTWTAEDLAPDQTVWVSVGQKGTVKRFAYRGMQMGRFKEISRNGSLTAVTANTREVAVSL